MTNIRQFHFSLKINHFFEFQWQRFELLIIIIIITT